MEEFWRLAKLNWWAPSRQLATFWVGIILGAVISNYFSLPTSTLLWILGLWTIVFVSGQEPRVEFLAVLLAGISSGMLLWAIADGESWFHPSLIGQIAEKLTVVRDQLIGKIIFALPEPQSSLLSGVLLGNRIKLDQELVEQFRMVGLSHIIAVSGYNLTILVANLRTAFRPMLGRHVFWLGLLVIGLFILLTGAPSSILRAGLMVGLLLLGEYLGRPRQSLLILLTAAGVLTIFEPKIVFDVGFQLSLAATYGLLRASPIFIRYLEKIRTPKLLATILGETFGAILLTSPIILVVFERLSIVSPLTNLLVVPLVPLLMTIGIIGALLVFIIPGIGGWLLMLSWPILTWILLVADYFAGLSFATKNLSISWWWAILLLLLIVYAIEYSTISGKKDEK